MTLTSKGGSCRGTPVSIAAWLGLGSVTEFNLTCSFGCCVEVKLMSSDLQDLMGNGNLDLKKNGVGLFQSRSENNTMWKKVHSGYFPSVTGNKASFAIYVWSVSSSSVC